MDQAIRKQILEEAIRVGDELLSLAEVDPNGISWKTMSIDYTRERTDPEYIIWKKSEGIYTGNSGMVLFMMALYQQTNDRKYLEAATDGMRWVLHYCAENPSDYFALFTGRLGVSYTLIQMFKLTGEDSYLQKALEIAEPCESFFENPGIVDDLINGVSGTVLGLLHLHAATGEEWILKKIDVFLKRLIDRSHRGPKGLYWDYSPKQIRGLCGFSHGAAGIGYVFLEAGRYFQNKALYQIAREAFEYEQFFYDENQLNWPDFRKGIWEPKDYEQHKDAFLSGNTGFFTGPQFMNAWCHGAAGIGLSRIRAYEILGDKAYAQQVIDAVGKTVMTDILPDAPEDEQTQNRSYTLCHGGGGNAELFLEAYRCFDNADYLKYAEKVALQALAIKRRLSYMSGFAFAGYNEDTSLFMGNAGIGYFYLKLLQPRTVPSVLLPAVHQTIANKADIPPASIMLATAEDIRRRILKKSFSRTFSISESIAGDSIDSYFETHIPNGISEEQMYLSFVRETLLADLQDQRRDMLEDVFALESEKFLLAQSISSSSLLNIKQVLQSERIAEILSSKNDAEILKTKVVINPDTKLLFTQWNWPAELPDNGDFNLDLEKDAFPVLLKADANEKVIENHLSPFSYAVIDAFTGTKTVEAAIGEIVQNFEVVTAEQEIHIRQSIIEQIQQALYVGFLVVADGNRE